MLAKKIAVTDATGSTVAISKQYSRKQVLLRNVTGGKTVWVGFNTDAVAELGFPLYSSDGIVLTGELAIADIYFVCASGETSDVYVQLSS